MIQGAAMVVIQAALGTSPNESAFRPIHFLQHHGGWLRPATNSKLPVFPEVESLKNFVCLLDTQLATLGLSDQEIDNLKHGQPPQESFPNAMQDPTSPASESIMVSMFSSLHTGV